MQRLLTMVLSCMAFLLSGFAMTGEAAYSIEGNVLGRALRVDGVADRAMGVCIEGDTLYCIAGDSLYSLDVSKPLSPTLLGSLRGMDNRRQVVSQDGFVYVVSRETGLRIVDARNPRKMRLRSRYDSVEFATGIDVVGRTVFLSERINGVEVVDVSNPDRPEHVCIRKTSESQSCRYKDGYLYSGEWGVGRVTVFDAKNLKSFRAIGSIELGGYGDGLEVADGYLYCSTGHDAVNYRSERCKNPELKLGKSGKAKVLECDVGAGRGMEIFDLSDPASPKRVSRIDFPVFKPRDSDYWTVRVADGLAFCCDSHNGLFVVDVNDPVKPRLVGRFCVRQEGRDWPSGAISSVAVGKACIYVTCNPGGLWVIPVAGVKPPKSNKGTPPESPEYRDPYATDESRFHVYRPAAAGQARTVSLRGDVAYAAFGDAGLHVLRIMPEGGFAKLGELPGGRRVTDCCFVGDRLVTAEGVDGFAVYRLEGSTGFREIARRKQVSDSSVVAFWCWAVGSRFVVLSSRVGGYHLFDIDDINRPTPLVRYSGTCQWDRYLSDGVLQGMFPTHVPRRGIAWLDVGGSVPKFCELDRKAEKYGLQSNGICVFDADRFLYTIKNEFAFVYPDRRMSERKSFPQIKDVGFLGGIPRSDGRIVVCTQRSSRRCAVWDFSVPEKPILLRTYTLSGNPDLAALHKGRAIIPAGHQGLLMERLPPR